jgi:hypothetical protein
MQRFLIGSFIALCGFGISLWVADHFGANVFREDNVRWWFGLLLHGGIFLTSCAALVLGWRKYRSKLTALISTLYISWIQQRSATG